MCGTIPYRGVTGTKMSDEHNGGEIEASLSNNGGQNIHPAFVCMAKKVTKILLQNNFNRKGDSDVTHECFNIFMKIVGTYVPHKNIAAFIYFQMALLHLWNFSGTLALG